MAKKPTLTLASSGEVDPMAKALADAQSRLVAEQQSLDALRQRFLVLQEQAQALNTEAVATEKRMIGIQGEITALTALGS